MYAVYSIDLVDEYYCLSPRRGVETVTGRLYVPTLNSGEMMNGLQLLIYIIGFSRTQMQQSETVGV